MSTQGVLVRVEPRQAVESWQGGDPRHWELTAREKQEL
jgi:hypothetical protein